MVAGAPDQADVATDGVQHVARAASADRGDAAEGSADRRRLMVARALRQGAGAEHGQAQVLVVAATAVEVAIRDIHVGAVAVARGRPDV